MGILAGLFLAPALLPLAATLPAYRIDARLEPASGSIEAAVEIEAPGAAAFSLSPELAIRRIEVDGRAVAFEEEPAAEPGAARTVRLAATAAARLRIAYGGRLRLEGAPAILRQVNGIHPERIELASYAAWLPRLEGAGSFSYRLALDVPAGFATVANGRRLSESTDRGRTRSAWVHDQGAWDVPLVSAPGLRGSAATHHGVAVEVTAAALPAAELEATRQQVAGAVDALVRLVGAPLPGSEVRLVYAPRPGWGYARPPLIVTSEERALALRRQPLGRARDLHHVAHEVAHFWWHRADASTPEDWINEGLAEYSAFLVSEELSGSDFARTLLAEYQERSDDSATTVSIVQTPNDSPAREVNRYARPVLLFEDARRRCGDERLRAFVRGLHRRFSASSATTGAFLEEAEASLGREARDRFAAALERRDWLASRGPARLSAQDAAILGRWAGTLVQGGASAPVVLDLTAVDGALAASLENPDPAAPAIPIPSARVEAGALTFGLGAFGIRYRGQLAPDRRSIEGEWTQGGIATPLRLVRRDPTASR